MTEGSRMGNYRLRLFAAALVAGALLVSPAQAFEDPPPPVPATDIQEGDDPLAEPKRRVEEATRGLLEALKLMMMAIPQYEAPEVLENGDIIIRRIHPGEPPRPAPDAPHEEDEAQT